MSRHRVALRAGVVTAVAAVVLTGLAAPAYADHDVRLGGIGNVDLQVGEGARGIAIQIENRDGGGNHNSLDGVARGVQVTLTVPLADVGVRVVSAPPECNRSNNDTRMDCTIGEIAPGQTVSLQAQIEVQGNAPLQAGESRNGAAQVALSTGAQTQFNVSVQGPDAPPAVAGVSGVVTDELTGEGLKQARITLVDSQQVEHTTESDSKGRYQFGSEQQIAAGEIAVRASKDGYEGRPNTYTVQAGQTLNDANLTLRNTAPPSPSDEPSPTASAPPSGSPTPVAAADTGSGSGGFFTTLMIILGVLFLLLGAGAIVLLILKRRRDQQEDDEGPEGIGPLGPDPQGPPPGPGSRGIYHPAETQVMGPRGGPLPAVGPQSALANAATAMMPPAGPEAAAETAMLPRVGDPPGPRPPAPGMAGRPYADSHTEVYDGSWHRQGGAPDHYDHPTQIGQAYEGAGSSGYQSSQGGGYGSQAYGTPSPGRHDQPGYGSHYDAGSYGPDPYTQPQRQPTESYGYPRSSRHEQPGYRRDQPGHQGYDQSGHQGYDQSTHQGYYDQSGTQPQPRHAEPPPRHAEPPPRHSEPAERRRLDWLDD